MNIIRKYLYVGIVLLFLLGTGIYVLLIKDNQQVSINENRNLATTSDLELTSFFDGSFQTTLEDVISDQFLYRNELVAIKKKMDMDLTSIWIDPNLKSLKLLAVGDSLRYQIGGSNYLMYFPMMYDGTIEKKIIDRIDQINQLSKDYSEIEMYIYRPLQAHELSIFDDANNIVSAGKKFNQLFKDYSNVPTSFLEINSLEQYKKLFYATDHHWNYRGSYQGYLDMMTMMNPDEALIEPTGIVCKEEAQFFGTHSNFTGRIFGGDQMCVYTFDYTPYEIIVNGEKIEDTNNPNYFAAHPLKEPNGYLYYYAYTAYASHSMFDTNRNDKENILVVGDSYAAPVAGLLASHFNQTHFVSPTDYLKEYKVRFNYDEFLKDNDIDKILFVYTIENYFYEDEWGEIYKNFDIIRNEE